MKKLDHKKKEMVKRMSSPLDYDKRRKGNKEWSKGAETYVDRMKNFGKPR